MIIKFFSNGIGGGAAPVDYLIAKDPLPEVLRGSPDQTRHLIDASTNQWSYTAGVISFAGSDAADEDAQQEVIDRFEELAFAGLDVDQYDCLWVRHVHEGNVELHFCTPRLELTEGKSLNIAPPGHEAAFNSLRDLLNYEHRWADPLEPDRALEFKPVRESADRAEARSAIIGAIYDQIDGGLITDRLTMIDFLEDAGFEVTRRAEKSISIRDPEFSKPFKLEGVLTHENWTPDRHAQISADRQAGTDADRPRRLDAHMNSFAESLNDILRNAKHTIESDMHELNANTRSIIENRLRWMKTTYRYAPWMILATTLIAMAALIGRGGPVF